MAEKKSEMPSGRRRGRLPGMTPSAGSPGLRMAPEPAEDSKPAKRVVKKPPTPRPRKAPATSDYSTTRLVNFRLPVELHDRYKRLLREVEDSDPRLRRPNLTELVVALLEDGPQTPEAAAEAIRSKRRAELS